MNKKQLKQKELKKLEDNLQLLVVQTQRFLQERRGERLAKYVERGLKVKELNLT